MRKLIHVAGWAAVAGAIAFAWSHRSADGCPRYTPIAGKILIAHAGGGLPHRTYANSTEAMDLAYSHGVRLFELDFREVEGTLRLGHAKPNGVTASDVLDWLKRHPGTLVVTDFKTDNVSGLRKLAKVAGPLKAGFIPQIYFPSEYAAVARLGMRRPILTLYRLQSSPVVFANSTDLLAVAMPVGRLQWAKGIKKPILLHHGQ